MTDSESVRVHKYSRFGEMMEIPIEIDDTEEIFETLCEETDEEYIVEDLESVVEERIAQLYSEKDKVKEQYRRE